MASAYVLVALFKTLKDKVWKAWSGEGVARIDNVVHKLNYRVTTCLLITFACILTFHGWFSLDNKPIECISESDNFKKIRAQFEQHCWMYPMNVSREEERWSEEEILRHTEGFRQPSERNFTFYYYQWVAFFFLLQAACFSAPRLLWTGLEGGALSALVQAVAAAEGTEGQAAAAATSLRARRSRGVNRAYAGASILMEVLFGLNILLQWQLTDSFIGSADTSHWDAPLGHWVTGVGQVRFYSLGWSTFTDDRALLSLNILFPKQIACAVNTHGMGFDRQTVEALCLLPLNVIQDKMFLVLWFWLLGLSLVTAAGLVYRAVMVSSEDCRRWKLETEVLGWEDGSQEAKERRTALKEVAKNHEDFFVFEQFRRNYSALVVREALGRLERKQQ